MSQDGRYNGDDLEGLVAHVRRRAENQWGGGDVIRVCDLLGAAWCRIEALLVEAGYGEEDAGDSP